MVVVLKRGSAKKSLQKSLEKLLVSKKSKKIDLNKYCGIISLEKDALQIQKDLRDEWE